MNEEQASRSLATQKTIHIEWLNMFDTKENNITKMEIEIEIHTYKYETDAKMLAVILLGSKKSRWLIFSS